MGDEAVESLLREMLADAMTFGLGAYVTRESDEDSAREWAEEFMDAYLPAQTLVETLSDAGVRLRRVETLADQCERSGCDHARSLRDALTEAT